MMNGFTPPGLKSHACRLRHVPCPAACLCALIQQTSIARATPSPLPPEAPPWCPGMVSRVGDDRSLAQGFLTTCFINPSPRHFLPMLSDPVL